MDFATKLAGNNHNGDFGWLENPQEVEATLATMPYPEITANMIGDLYENEEKTIVLSDVFRKLSAYPELGNYAPCGPQGIGDCVSFGTGGTLNYLQATEILTEGNIEGEEYQEMMTEALYALSRVDIGKQKGSYNDGSVGAWAAKAATDIACISRKLFDEVFPSGDKYGSSVYSAKRAKDWGANGVPDKLKAAAKQKYFAKTASLVTSYDQLKKLISNGYPVMVCSDQGFSLTRDDQGFAAPKGTWYHCMFFMGIRFDRPGALCAQSWGINSPTGPKVLNQPSNTFWVDQPVAQKMLNKRDSFTFAGFQGYKGKDLLNWVF